MLFLILKLILWIVVGAVALLAAVWALAWNTGDYIVYHRMWGGRLHRYRVKNNHWLPKVTPWHEFAITIGDQVFCVGVLEDYPESHAHEFNHVVEGGDAMAGDGPLPDDGARRYVWYLKDLVRFGYRNIPEEQRSQAFGREFWREFTREQLKVG